MNKHSMILFFCRRIVKREVIEMDKYEIPECSVFPFIEGEAVLSTSSITNVENEGHKSDGFYDYSDNNTLDQDWY